MTSRSHKQAFYCSAWWKDEQQWASIDTRRVQAECKEILVSHEGSQAVPSLGDFQDWTGQSPEQPDLRAGLALIRSLGWRPGVHLNLNYLMTVCY